MTDQAERALEAHRRLLARFPDAVPALVYGSPFELLISVVLSAQTTDMQVNRVTPVLFNKYRSSGSLASAELQEVERIIRPVGFYHQKSRMIISLSRMLEEIFDGRIPDSLKDLVRLPGVGRKSSHIVLGMVYGQNSGIAVDTHVGRIARRLGLSNATSADRVEYDLEAMIPVHQWRSVNLTWVLHGRQTCTAARPRCDTCLLADICPRVGV